MLKRILMTLALTAVVAFSGCRYFGAKQPDTAQVQGVTDGKFWLGLVPEGGTNGNPQSWRFGLCLSGMTPSAATCPDPFRGGWSFPVPRAEACKMFRDEAYVRCPLGSASTDDLPEALEACFVTTTWVSGSALVSAATISKLTCALLGVASPIGLGTATLGAASFAASVATISIMDHIRRTDEANFRARSENLVRIFEKAMAEENRTVDSVRALVEEIADATQWCKHCVEGPINEEAFKTSR
jgi:hypothetical protein